MGIAAALLILRSPFLMSPLVPRFYHRPCRPCPALPQPRLLLHIDSLKRRRGRRRQSRVHRERQAKNNRIRTRCPTPHYRPVPHFCRRPRWSHPFPPHLSLYSADKEAIGKKKKNENERRVERIKNERRRIYGRSCPPRTVRRFCCRPRWSDPVSFCPVPSCPYCMSQNSWQIFMRRSL